MPRNSGVVRALAAPAAAQSSFPSGCSSPAYLVMLEGGPASRVMGRHGPG
jgi:hypothetical protein